MKHKNLNDLTVNVHSIVYFVVRINDKINKIKTDFSYKQLDLSENFQVLKKEEIINNNNNNIKTCKYHTTNSL